MTDKQSQSIGCHTEGRADTRVHRCGEQYATYSQDSAAPVGDFFKAITIAIAFFCGMSAQSFYRVGRTKLAKTYPWKVSNFSGKISQKNTLASHQSSSMFKSLVRLHIFVASFLRQYYTNEKRWTKIRNTVGERKRWIPTCGWTWQGKGHKVSCGWCLSLDSTKEQKKGAFRASTKIKRSTWSKFFALRSR